MTHHSMMMLADAATVVCRQDGKVKQANSLVGGVWGMLIGLLFWAPWLGLTIGAITGAIAGKFSDVGIDDDFIKEVSNTIEPGHSPLFLLVAQATPDKVLAELQKFQPTPIFLRTSLSTEGEAWLKTAFGAHEEEEGAEG